MANETVRVKWVTTIEETHVAEIPVDEYRAMIDAGTFTDDLAEYEDSYHAISSGVTDREILEASA